MKAHSMTCFQVSAQQGKGWGEAGEVLFRAASEGAPKTQGLHPILLHNFFQIIHQIMGRGPNTWSCKYSLIRARVPVRQGQASAETEPVFLKV